MFAQELWIFHTWEIQNHESQHYSLYQIIYAFVKKKRAFLKEFRIYILKIFINKDDNFKNTAKNLQKNM